MWLTPNLCDNMHNCSISRGDGYLSKLIPIVLNSYIFRTQKAALFITFDEGSGRYPTDYVYSIWAGPAVITRYKSSTQFSHYSLPGTIEAAWGLQPLTKKDAGSSSMMQFFPSPTPPPAPLQAGFTFSPGNPDTNSTVNFSGSAKGGTQPYNYTWSFGDGNKGIGQRITYVYSDVGNYTARLTVADALGQKTSTSQAISIDKDPNAVGTCQGCRNTAFPRTLGLVIGFAIGVAVPIALSSMISKRHRRTT